MFLGGAQLTLTSQPQTSGTYCPGHVTFTCEGSQIIPTLLWLVNGSEETSYNFRNSHTFPQTLPPLNVDGVIATVTNVSINPPGAGTIDITSVLSVSDVSVLNGTSLQCETITGSNRSSNLLRIGVNSFSKLIDLDPEGKSSELSKWC